MMGQLCRSRRAVGVAGAEILPGACSPHREQLAAGAAVVSLAVDQDDLRRLVARMLERWGGDVREFSGLEAARAAAAGLEWAALLVTDAQLGDGNGVDLARDWTADGTCGSVLVITGYTELDVEAGTSEIAGCEILTKPFTMRDLNRAVDRGLRRAQSRRE